MQNIGPGQLNLDHIDHESGELQKSKCIVVKLLMRKQNFDWIHGKGFSIKTILNNF